MLARYRPSVTDQLDIARIEAVIFDFGGVLTVSPKQMMGSRAKAAGRSMEEMMPLLIGPLDHDSDHPWHRAERGELSLADFLVENRALLNEAGIEQDLKPPAPEQMLSALTAVPEMLAAATAARSHGHRTAILSNNIREYAAWRSIVDADELVDVVVDSCEVGMRKPTAEIFTLTADRLGVAPEHCLMVDDFEWNLRGAERTGLQSFYVGDPVADAARLRATLGI